MSYARMSDYSDVYVVRSCDSLVCLGCELRKSGSFATEKWQVMIDHLHAHREAGHLVPQRAINRLQRELDTEDE